MVLYVHCMCSDVWCVLPHTGHHYDLTVCLCEVRYVCVFCLNVMPCPPTLGCAPVQKSHWGPCWWLQIQLSGPLILNSLVINRVWHVGGQLRRSRTDRLLRSNRRTSCSDVGMHTVFWFGPGRLYEMQTDGQTGGRMKTEGRRTEGQRDMWSDRNWSDIYLEQSSGRVKRWKHTSVLILFSGSEPGRVVQLFVSLLSTYGTSFLN